MHLHWYAIVGCVINEYNYTIITIYSGDLMKCLWFQVVKFGLQYISILKTFMCRTEHSIDLVLLKTSLCIG